LIVVFVVTVSGIAAGAWLGDHRLALGLYFVIWGASWFVGSRAIVKNPEYLEHMSRSRARLPWYRDRVDFVERGVRYQRRVFKWLFEPVGVGLTLVGIFMFVGQLLGRSA